LRLILNWESDGSSELRSKTLLRHISFWASPMRTVRASRQITRRLPSTIARRPIRELQARETTLAAFTCEVKALLQIVAKLFGCSPSQRNKATDKAILIWPSVT